MISLPSKLLCKTIVSTKLGTRSGEQRERTYPELIEQLPANSVYPMQEVVKLGTHQREELVDITHQVGDVVARSGIMHGVVTVYAQGATAATMIQENWDESVQTDVVHLLQKLIPRGVWLHDRQDGNGDSHLKAGLVGPSETIPIINGRLGLSRWQNIFFCEFDGPRRERQVLCTVLSDS